MYKIKLDIIDSQQERKLLSILVFFTETKKLLLYCELPRTDISLVVVFVNVKAGPVGVNICKC